MKSHCAALTAGLHPSCGLPWQEPTLGFVPRCPPEVSTVCKRGNEGLLWALLDACSVEPLDERTRGDIGTLFTSVPTCFLQTETVHVALSISWHPWEPPTSASQEPHLQPSTLELLAGGHCGQPVTAQ